MNNLSSFWLRIIVGVTCIIILCSAIRLKEEPGDVDRSGDVGVAKMIPQHGGQASETGVCFGDDIYQGDIIVDERFIAIHGLPSAERSNRSLVIENDIHSSKDGQPHGFRSKKVQRIQLARDARKTQEKSLRVKRGATAYKRRLWPDKIIPYTIDDVFDNKTRNLLHLSMQHWEQYTCLRFIPHTDQSGYIEFVASDGCCSQVGYYGVKQLISIGPGCETLGTMVHELGHAIGFWHEQSRPDRDSHVSVLEENVPNIVRHNFRKYDDYVIDSLGQPYDFESIMHYGSRSFSKNYQKTIIPLRGNEIGQHRVLSVGDILQANLLYRCSKMIGGCGGAIFQADGHITSPHYPAPSAPNTTCDWSIGVEDGFALKLEFIDIDLPVDDDSKCQTNAFVELREGLGELSPLIGRFCGNRLPSPITLDNGNAWIRFKSGTRRNLDMSGFVIRFKSVSLHKKLSDLRGVLKSLNYPLSFPPGTDTVWQITLQEGVIVNLRIDELLIPRSSKTGCLGDYLMIIDGPSSQSPMITKLCQSQKRVGVASSGPNLRIEMHSGPPTTSADSVQMHEIGLSNETPTRFHASYSARDVNECRNNNGGCEQACLNMFGGHVCGCQYGYVIDSNYKNCTDVDECLANNGGCSHLCVNTEGAYHCACPDGYYLSPQNKTHCIDENECDDPARNRCQQHCHNTLGGYACSCPSGFILDTDNMSCIELSYCGGYLNDYEDSLLSPVVPQDNNNSFDCVWQISVDEDFIISLRFFFDYWPATDYCHSYIDVLEGRGPTSGHFRLCDDSDNTEDMYRTTSNIIWVHYHSQAAHEGIFQIDYYTQMKDNSTIECGGELNGTGTLESPGYPNVYPNKVDCIWKITGKGVKLSFENFDLEKEERCQFDFLDIMDGHHREPSSRHIGRFCGDASPPSELRSSTGALYIKFQSDATVQGRGFRAVFEVENA
ncbi:tolloid-like protein 1 [Amphiura filiformis]|uniref:tolloid-like protein 1 n=1 Tax=Amphiura filiformis TaxID=82378 RepID=UPI003B21D2AD